MNLNKADYRGHGTTNKKARSEAGFLFGNLANT